MRRIGSSPSISCPSLSFIPVKGNQEIVLCSKERDEVVEIPRWPPASEFFPREDTSPAQRECILSLTSFLAQPDVRARFKETFPYTRIALEQRPLIEPLTTHYALVGTAFDYLLRFALQHRHAHALAEPWIAEQVIETLSLSLEEAFGEETARMAEQFVQQAKHCHAQYLLDGILTEDLLRSALLLAQLDPFFRAEVLYEPFGEVDEQDVEDLRQLYAAVPLERLASQSLCLLNPTFGASSLVGGADVDLVLDGIMIDVKTTKVLRMKREYVNQLLGYYTLSLLGGVTGMSQDATIREVGIYFSRYGYLATWPLEYFASKETFLQFSNWFQQRARRGRVDALQRVSRRTSPKSTEGRPDAEEGTSLSVPVPRKIYSFTRFPQLAPTSLARVLLLLDGHALLQRAYEGWSETLTNTQGEMVNATFGFTSLLIEALHALKPAYLAVAFDRQAPTFRHLQFASYKAHRPPLPEHMRPQFGRIREIVQAFGIPIYEMDGFEADDVLGTLAQQATQMGIDTIILTGDIDTLQLVNDHMKVLVVRRGIAEAAEYTADDVRQRLGVPPARIPDYKGLRGDVVDNIPRVKGMGEKTTKKLLAEYGDLEQIFAHLDDLTSRDQRLLRGKEESARQSKYLATIVCNVPVQLDLEVCRVSQLNQERAIALFRTLELGSLVEQTLSIQALIQPHEVGTEV